jgi:hypothetical protein
MVDSLRTERGCKNTMPHHSYVDMNKLWPPAFEGAIIDLMARSPLPMTSGPKVDRIFLGSQRH